MSSDDPTNILVVDDLPEKLLVYRTMLEDIGQNIVTARSGEEALKQVLRQEFAVVLLDVNMPGMNGFETAEIIRKRKKSAFVPIIFLTAFADEVCTGEGYEHGAVDFITTPVVPAILRAKVRVFVDLFRMTRQVRRQAEERIALTEERAKRAAAEEANRRLAFLAEASRILAGSLDAKAIARAVARLVVPALAEVGGVTLAEEPGHPQQTKLVWVGEPGKKVNAQWLTDEKEPSDTLHEAVHRSLKTSTPIRLENLDIKYVPDPGRPAPAGGCIRAVSVFPLLARGRTLGALTLAFGAADRGRDPADLATAADLASRAAMALDNARLYSEIQQADRNKNEFLATLAHELRNPLAPIRNGLSILRQIGGLTGTASKTRDMIDRQVSHMVRLIDDLMDVSRITRGKIDLKPERLDLRAALDVAVEASRPYFEAARHTFLLDIPEGSYPLRADPTRLAQVFSNLLNNAAKYTPDEGTIRMDVERENGSVLVRVKDNGIGMAPDVLTTVFDIFTQVGNSQERSQGGLGIGLTLVRRLVEMHGGVVSAQSPGLEKGSTFIVKLPLIPAIDGRHQ